MQRISTVAARIARHLGNLALVLVVIASGAYLLPHFMGYERYVITGGSMSGSIEKGSVVFEKPRPVTELEVGDVITYLPPADSGVGTLVTHRIVEIADQQGQLVLKTKGDANDDVDPWAFSLVEQQQPVVEYTVPVIGYGLMALADRETRMLLIGVPAGIVALIALVELGKNLRGMRRPEPAGNGAAGATPAQ